MLSRLSWQHLRNYCLKVGDNISIKRKVSVEDVKAFADLTNDQNPIHLNSQKGIVHGALLNGFVSGVIGTTLPGYGTIVVQQDLRFPKPCYAGDEVNITEVTIKVIIKSVRKIIEVEFHVFKGDEEKEEVVLEGNAKVLIPFHQNSMKFRKEPNYYGHDYLKL